MTNKKKLFLLDAYALIYRSFFAFIKNPRINSKGLDTSAIFGFTNTLMEIIKKERPSHIAVVFDRGGPTFRHKEFPEYKANREPAPDGIINAKPYIDKLLSAMNIEKLYLDGYEADDVIGTIAKKAEQENFQVFMMTPDKDFAQLVSENIFMYRPATKWGPSEVWGIKEILEKFKINNVKQVIDFLGMMGDSVDNIPGLPGVGEKTAQKFIQKYGSMENLLANTSQLKGKMKEKIEANKKQGILSKKLATIETNAPINFKKDYLKLKEFNKPKLKVLFEELEFNTIASRILSFSFISEENQKTITEDIEFNSGQLDMFVNPAKEEKVKLNEAKNYQEITNLEKINLICNKIIESNRFSFHIIGDFNQNEISGISLSYKKGDSVYIPYSKEGFKIIKYIFNLPGIIKVGFNIKSDLKLLKQYDISKLDNIFDISIAHYLLSPESRHDIHILAENYLSYDMIDINSILGKGKNKRKIYELSNEKKMSFSCEYTDISLQLSDILEKELRKNNCIKLFNDIEMPLIHTLSIMEDEGISLNLKELTKFSNELQDNILSLNKEIWVISGENFNISSPKQLGEVLFEKMKISDAIKKTKSGQYSTSEETLSKIKKNHPIIEKILEYRTLQKLHTTYVKNLPLLVNKKTGRIHTTFNQSITSTGRLSSANPNLQNIPIRSDKGKRIRMSFIPRNKDYTLLCADYSQIELRIMAELSRDTSMLKAFNNQEDIHLATAAKVYNVSPKSVTREMRSNAKMVNFGIIYGISAFGLSQRLGIKRGEAKNIIEQYFSEFPGIKKYINNSISQARKNEYVETIFGRRRYLSNINSKNSLLRSYDERNAINAPIQGSAADIIKIAMIKIQKSIEEKNLKSKMILQVHDELIFDMKKSESDILKNIVRKKMEESTILNVPLTVDVGVGENWLEAH